MTKSELIARMAARNLHLRAADMEAAVNTVLDQIADGMARGDRVEIRGFGVFWTKERASRRSRNPRTGEAVDVESKRIPFFRAGRAILARLNSSAYPEPSTGME